MLDGEDTTLDQGTPDNPASGEVETSSQATDTSDQEQDLEADTGQDGEDGSPDDEEFEHAGKTYRISKELKPLLMMQADYTRKTQEVAETRKALESEKETLSQQAEAIKAIDEGEKQLWAIDQRIAAYSKINWAQLEQEDFTTAQTRWREYSQIKDYRATVAAQVDEAKAKRSESVQLERAKRIQEAHDTARKIPGWNAEVAAKVEGFGQSSLGFTPKQLDQAVETFGGAFVKTLHKAWLADQLISKQQAAAKTPSTPAEPIKPLAVVAKGKAPARSGMSDDMSIEDWVKARDRQLRPKG